jgi:kynurenine formamidase
MTATDTLPGYDELPRIGGLPCSWGLWGSDDRFGCLNLLTPERVRDAARGVRRGAQFSLNWRMDLPEPPLFDRPRIVREVVPSTTSPSLNELISDWNTQDSTQWDGFGHVPRVGFGFYNGLDAGEHSIGDWADRGGLSGRGLLLDVERWRASVGRPLAQGTSERITVDDLEATAAAQGSVAEPGTILIIRTGWIHWYESLTEEERAAVAPGVKIVNPGLDPSDDMARYLWDSHVAAVAADNPGLELWPPGALVDEATRAAIAADPSRRHEISLHSRLIPMLGLTIGELWRLDELAEDCAIDGVYDFLLTTMPLNLPNGLASPANAIAIK